MSRRYIVKAITVSLCKGLAKFELFFFDSDAKYIEITLDIETDVSQGIQI